MICQHQREFFKSFKYILCAIVHPTVNKAFYFIQHSTSNCYIAFTINMLNVWLQDDVPFKLRTVHTQDIASIYVCNILPKPDPEL